MASTVRVRLRRPATVALIVTSVYLAAVLSVIYVEYASEVAKLARGAYTDTFRPLGFARVAAWPGSHLGPAPRYPDGPFDAAAFRTALQPSLHACLRAALGQAGLVYVLCLAIARQRRRGSTSR